MRKPLTYLLQFTLGGLAYGGLEVAYRGYTHRSMILVGGLCFVMLCMLARSGIGLFAGALTGGLGVTAIEFCAGAVFNMWLGLGVWDYSNLPFNLFGQVCLNFTLLWCVLSGIVIFSARVIRGAFLIYLEKSAALSAEKAIAQIQRNRIV